MKSKMVVRRLFLFPACSSGSSNDDCGTVVIRQVSGVDVGQSSPLIELIQAPQKSGTATSEYSRRAVPASGWSVSVTR